MQRGGEHPGEGFEQGRVLGSARQRAHRQAAHPRRDGVGADFALHRVLRGHPRFAAVQARDQRDPTRGAAPDADAHALLGEPIDHRLQAGRGGPGAPDDAGCRADQGEGIHAAG